MRMRPFRKQPVSSAARRLFEIVGSTTSLEDAARLVASTYTNDLVRPPTDLQAIALRLNIQEICSEDLPVSGELRRNGKGFRLIYSSYLSPTQRRFTIAHEIGHAIFENSGPNCPRRGKELERICDMIAAELLMPEPLFLEMAGSEASAATVVELATSFQTSLAATGIRYAKLKGVSVFQIDDQRVIWGSGVIREGCITESRLFDSNCSFGNLNKIRQEKHLSFAPTLDRRVETIMGISREAEGLCVISHVIELPVGTLTFLTHEGFARHDTTGYAFLTFGIASYSYHCVSLR